MVKEPLLGVQVLPTSGTRSISLWDVPDIETLQTWLDEFLDVDCTNEVYQVCADMCGTLHNASVSLQITLERPNKQSFVSMVIITAVVTTMPPLSLVYVPQIQTDVRSSACMQTLSALLCYWVFGHAILCRQNMQELVNTATDQLAVCCCRFKRSLPMAMLNSCPGSALQRKYDAFRSHRLFAMHTAASITLRLSIRTVYLPHHAALSCVPRAVCVVQGSIKGLT